MCDHCNALEKVLNDLLGTTASRIVAERVYDELHDGSHLLSTTHVKDVAAQSANASMKVDGNFVDW